MNDIIGQEIHVGDLVVVTDAGTGTSYLSIEQVTGFTPCKVRLGKRLKSIDKLLVINDIFKEMPELYLKYIGE